MEHDLDKYKIRNKQNKGYYLERTEGWTTFERSTTYTAACAQKAKDALERKERYYGKLEIESLSTAEGDARD